MGITAFFRSASRSLALTALSFALSAQAAELALGKPLRRRKKRAGHK